MGVKEIDFLLEIAEKGGPEVSEYEQVAACFASIMKNFRSGKYSMNDLGTVATSLGDVFSMDTTQGFVLQKPYGYAGDFEVIDRIYQRYTSPKAHLAKWDNFAHSRRSNQAVRNRKDYFIDLLSGRTNSASCSDEFRVLNVGCGPARDVCEFLDKDKDRNVLFDCLDQDPRAIEYAKSVCARHLDHISFITANVFRFKAPAAYSLVWSAGLFDYLEDETFLFLLKRLCLLAASGGEVVIGNFSPLNPDQDYMAFGGWTLHYRTPEQLMELVTASRIQCDNICINSEEEGINLFLHLKQLRKD